MADQIMTPGSSRYHQLDLFELSEAGTRTAKQADAAEGESVEAWLDHAEVLYEGRDRLKANKAFGEWWDGLHVSYGSAWRAVLIKIGERIAAEGRPSYTEYKTDGRFSLRDWANGGGEGAAEPSDEWYTPAWLFHALDLTYDIDVCAPIDRTHCTTPARQFIDETTNGLLIPWEGLVWCNPPYSSAGPWADRMIAHGNGLLLSHVPINGEWCLDTWRTANAVTLFQGMHFVRPGGELQRPAWWLQLVAFGDTATKALTGMPTRIPDEIEPRWRPGPVWT